MGLSDQVLIKDNHLLLRQGGGPAAHGIADAIETARRSACGLKVEVEVASLEELAEALTAAPDIIMLDNMSPEIGQDAADAVRAIDPDVTIEVSGGITPESCVDYAPFADVISLGWLTHSVRSIDFSMNVA
jgi:nicotinate-nucleotide pyrophosphorylase (carboxylating)